MPVAIITTIISAVAIISGSLLGALFSYIISSKLYKKQSKDEAKFKCKSVCDNANIIRLDIATSVFQSIRSIQNSDENKKYLYQLPINKNYSAAVASLSSKYTLKELSYLYQLYGIIEKVNRDISKWSLGDDEAYKNVQIGLISILYKIYGENYKQMLLLDAEKVSYQELYNNDFIDMSYKDLLFKLEEFCILENLLSKD